MTYPEERLSRRGALFLLSNHLFTRVTKVLNINLHIELFAILLDTSTGCPDNSCNILLSDLELNHVAAVDSVVLCFLDNPQDVLGGMIDVGWRATNNNNVLITVSSDIDCERTTFTNEPTDCEKFANTMKKNIRVESGSVFASDGVMPPSLDRNGLCFDLTEGSDKCQYFLFNLRECGLFFLYTLLDERIIDQQDIGMCLRFVGKINQNIPGGVVPFEAINWSGHNGCFLEGNLGLTVSLPWR
jgi:hypothetical protein